MPGPFHCPSCQRIVYNRRLAACEFCGVEMPEGIRLSPAEVAAWDRRQDEWAEDAAARRMARASEALPDHIDFALGASAIAVTIGQTVS